MCRLPFRTGATDLSQDNLLLLDVLFDGGAPIRLLRREGFVEQWMSCPHNLDDSQLRAELRAMCDHGLLCPDANSRGEQCVVMTEHGGDLWSQERCPAWDRYLIDCYRETIQGVPYVSIKATSAAIAYDMLRFGGPCGNWILDGVRVRKFKIRNHHLIPWRSFPHLYVLVAMNYAESDSYFSDPTTYRQHLDGLAQQRTWWRSVRELQKFLPASS
jgi:hypothetical protein